MNIRNLAFLNFKLIFISIMSRRMSEIAGRIPLVYSPKYNISFFGIENYLHAFDSKKYGRVFDKLAKTYNFSLNDCYEPYPLDEHLLWEVHTRHYLNTLKSSFSCARIAEVPLLALFPNFIIQSNLLNPMRLATSGTVLASSLALQYGAAINLSGGYHHAKTDGGQGFCFFADIPLAIHSLLTNESQRVKRVLIVDLDAHQGNGFETIFTRKDFVDNNKNPDKKIATSAPKLYYDLDDRVHILDFYNGSIYPGDKFAKKFITYDVPLRNNTTDQTYLNKLKTNLTNALMTSQPDIVFYNAGTDIFEDDPLGSLSITAKGIVERDEMVFRLCKERKVPLVMTLSGGYTQESANIISDSIINLVNKKLFKILKEGDDQKED